jgi:putative transposase
MQHATSYSIPRWWRLIHKTAKFLADPKGLNNRAENSHQPTRRRERQRKRFKSARQVQRFVSIHDPIANLFHVPRNRITATEHRAARSQAFETWAEIAGARLAA